MRIGRHLICQLCDHDSVEAESLGVGVCHDVAAHGVVARADPVSDHRHDSRRDHRDDEARCPR